MFYPSKGPVPEGMSEAEHRKSGPDERPYKCEACQAIRLHAHITHHGRPYLVCLHCDLTSQVV